MRGPCYASVSRTEMGEVPGLPPNVIIISPTRVKHCSYRRAFICAWITVTITGEIRFIGPNSLKCITWEGVKYLDS